MNKSSLLLLIILLNFGMAEAQNECADALPSSILAYNNGNIDECVDILSSCVTNLHSREERIESHRLLALCYLYLNESDKMHNHIKLLIKLQPEYGELTLGKDPKEFSKTVAQYSSKPDWLVGIGIGGNATLVNVIENNQFYQAAKSKYMSVPSYSASFALKKNIGSNLYIAGNLQACGAGIQHELQLDEGTSQEYRENMDFLGLALDLGYNIPLVKSYQFSVFGTLAYNQMYSHRSSMELSQNNILINQQSFDRLDHRTTSQPSIGLGVDLNFPVQNGTLGVGASYTSFLRTTIKKEALYDVDFNFTSLYNNDLIKLRQVGLFVHYSYPISFKVTRITN